MFAGLFKILVESTSFELVTPAVSFQLRRCQYPIDNENLIFGLFQ